VAKTVTSTTDHRLRQLTIVAAPILLLASLAYLAVEGASSLRIAINGIVCGAFLATGLLAWARRPANRTGRVMVATGLFLLLDPLQDGAVPALAPVGLIATTVSDILLGYLILAFPWGTLRSNIDRAFLGASAVAMLSANLAAFAGFDPRAIGRDYDNPFLFIRDPGVAEAAMSASRLTSIVVLIGFLTIFAIRWARASGPARRTYSPVLIPSTVLVIAIMVSTILSAFPVPDDLSLAAGVTQALARAFIPVGFLVGLLRTRMARSAIADLVVELGETPAPARLRDALANALGDPSLTVAYWSPAAGAYLAADGSTAELPSETSARAVTFLERDGQPIAAILHDPVLLEDPGLVASVASAMRLSVENERLQAEVEAQLGEVRESRARIVAAGDAERKRVERDLHDGAQQRLVSLTLALRLAKLKLGDDGDPELRLSLDQASDEARSALSELRELARGIHPQILTEAGLGSAIESLADRSSVDVAVDLGTDQRFSPAVEATAYFVVSEALANVAKYAAASRALVRTGWQDGELTIEIADDGVGGAKAGPGGGLRGLADRLSAIDGRLEIVSPTGGGTRLLAHIPTGTPAAMPG
jgi:signal transduction histidine kinase